MCVRVDGTLDGNGGRTEWRSNACDTERRTVRGSGLF